MGFKAGAVDFILEITCLLFLSSLVNLDGEIGVSTLNGE